MFLVVAVPVSRVAEVHAGQLDLAMIALDCRGDHPFADVICLNDLSFPHLVQVHTNSMFLSEYTCTHAGRSGRYVVFALNKRWGPIVKSAHFRKKDSRVQLIRRTHHSKCN